jgi:hypothetical protein
MRSGGEFAALSKWIVAVIATLLADFVPWRFLVAGRISAGQHVIPATKKLHNSGRHKSNRPATTRAD